MIDGSTGFRQARFDGDKQTIYGLGSLCNTLWEESDLEKHHFNAEIKAVWQRQTATKRVMVVALTDIEPGDELFYSYGRTYEQCDHNYDVPQLNAFSKAWRNQRKE